MSESMIPATAQWTVVARRQLALLWESGRVWLLLAACVAPMAFVEAASVQARMGHAPDRAMRPAYPLLDVMTFLAIAALVWPLLVWREETWGKREYHWSLPVQRSAHDLWRVAAGAAWLIVATAACAALGVTFEHLHGSAPIYTPDGSHAHFHPGALFWASFFVGPLIVYGLASILPLAVRKPLEWTAALFGFYLLLAGIATTLRWDWLDQLGNALSLFVEHTFGLRTALAGGAWTEWLQFLSALEVQRIDFGPFSRFRTPTWLVSAALWLGLSIAGVVLATLRRR